ncbi:MAG: hypothetical protein ACREBW_10260 [Candidatus Micrarchaeaceae archaeon]
MPYLPPGPGSLGAPVGPPPGDTRNQQIDVYAADFAAQFGDKVGQAFANWARGSARKNFSVAQLAQAFATIIATQGVAKAIGAGAGGLGGFLGASGSAGLGTLNNMAGGTNDWQHLLIRIGEFMVGGLLIAVGLNSMLRQTNVYKQAQNAAVTTAKVAK